MGASLLEALRKHYESSLKAFLTALLELELSMQLVLSFFECEDVDTQDEQELQTLYSLSWEPLALSLFLVFGHRVAPRLAPAPENEDRNMLRCKIFTWVYSLAFLIWDDDMTVKTGPSLGIAILFCVCDLARFQMEVLRLIDDYTDDEEAPSDVEYAAHMLGLDAPPAPTATGRRPSKAADASRATGSNRGTASEQAAALPSWDAPVRGATGADAAPSGAVRLSLSAVHKPPQPPPQQQPGPAPRPALQPYRARSTRFLRKKSSSGVNASAAAGSALEATPTHVTSEFVAVVDERGARSGANADAERALGPKSSLVYEF